MVPVCEAVLHPPNPPAEAGQALQRGNLVPGIITEGDIEKHPPNPLQRGNLVPGIITKGDIEKHTPNHPAEAGQALKRVISYLPLCNMSLSQNINGA